jgi:hypothetical protein
MRHETVLSRNELFAAAATLAAHAGARDGGFRQRDVRFLIHLFSNWVERTLGNSGFPLSNTQVHRYLEDLARNGFAKVNRRSKQPAYTLTRLGLLELVTRAVRRREGSLPAHFFFLCYFLRSYRPKLLELVAKEGRLFPHSLALELDALLDTTALIEDEQKRVQLELRKLEQRASDALHAAQMAKKLFSRNVPSDQIVGELEKQYPYELNSEKPLSELMTLVPSAYVRWELETGNAHRAEQIWQPSLALMREYSEQLQKLREMDGHRK